MSSLGFMSSSVAQMFVTSERLPFSGCMTKKAVVLEQMIPCLECVWDITRGIGEKRWNVCRRKVNYIPGIKTWVYFSWLYWNQTFICGRGSNAFKIEAEGSSLSKSYVKNKVINRLRVRRKNPLFSVKSIIFIWMTHRVVDVCYFFEVAQSLTTQTESLFVFNYRKWINNILL